MPPEKAHKEKDVASLSFEEALAELEAIVQRLEKGELGLEDAITTYERGVGLKRRCDEKLKDAQLRVEKIEAKDGALKATPFDAA
ncbi:MAG: exodeoxyribonuclease VII small subunit [Alphaproteobacteria bacterium]|nr:exodeoxyribonuclease VII small subunit [Alphaproteobacteria bacterium]